jgi:hypothetical protein
MKVMETGVFPLLDTFAPLKPKFLLASGNRFNFLLRSLANSQLPTIVFQTYGIIDGPSATSWSREFRDHLFTVPHVVCGVGSIA